MMNHNHHNVAQAIACKTAWTQPGLTHNFHELFSGPNQELIEVFRMPEVDFEHLKAHADHVSIARLHFGLQPQGSNQTPIFLLQTSGNKDHSPGHSGLQGVFYRLEPVSGSRDISSFEDEGISWGGSDVVTAEMPAPECTQQLQRHRIAWLDAQTIKNEWKRRKQAEQTITADDFKVKLKDAPLNTVVHSLNFGEDFALALRGLKDSQATGLYAHMGLNAITDSTPKPNPPEVNVVMEIENGDPVMGFSSLLNSSFWDISCPCPPYCGIC